MGTRLEDHQNVGKIIGTRDDSGESPNNQTVAARRTMDWQLVGRSTVQRV